MRRFQLPKRVAEFLCRPCDRIMVAALRFDPDEQRNVVEEDERVRKLRPFPFPARASVDEVTEE